MLTLSLNSSNSTGNSGTSCSHGRTTHSHQTNVSFMIIPVLLPLIIVTTSLLLVSVEGFVIPTSPSVSLYNDQQSSRMRVIYDYCTNKVDNNNSVDITMKRRRQCDVFSLHAKVNDDDDDDDDDQQELITKEMFHRDMLNINNDYDDHDDNENDETKTSHTSHTSSNIQEGKTKRKKRNGTHYRVLDNRDNLPFLVKVTTPDPYTNNDIMQKQARKNTQELARGYKSKHNNGNKKTKDMNHKRHNLVGMDGVDSIASSIYRRKKDGSLDQILGEFALDKATNCGDIIDVGDGMEYQVQKARCQYKYVGGKKFVMTRKILEVKEMKRILVEREVKQLFENDGSQNDSGDDDGILHLE